MKRSDLMENIILTTICINSFLNKSEFRSIEFLGIRVCVCDEGKRGISKIIRKRIFFNESIEF